MKLLSNMSKNVFDVNQKSSIYVKSLDMARRLACKIALDYSVLGKQVLLVTNNSSIETIKLLNEISDYRYTDSDNVEVISCDTLTSCANDIDSSLLAYSGYDVLIVDMSPLMHHFTNYHYKTYAKNIKKSIAIVGICVDINLRSDTTNCVIRELYGDQLCTLEEVDSIHDFTMMKVLKF